LLRSFTESFFILVGLMFLVLGLVFLLIPLILKLGLKLENIHPLILWWKKIDGFYVGTSPILLIILLAVYFLSIFLKKG